MILAFNGPASSGKDEACSYLNQRHGVKSMSFKFELFKKTIEHFKVSKEWFMDGYDDRSRKEEPEELLTGLSRRQALIYVSETLIKPVFGKTYFAEQLQSNLDPAKDYSISDLGFDEEISFLINKMGTEKLCLVQLLREGCDYSKDSRKYVHGQLVEELYSNQKTYIDDSQETTFPIRMYRIHNNGTKEAFHQMLESIYEKELHANGNKASTSVLGMPV